MTRIRAVFAATVVLLMVTSPATAHVTIPDEAEEGSFFKLTFRTPNERDDAGTTRLSVQFPEEHPFAFLNVRPVDGWTVDVERTTLDEPFEVFGSEYTEAVTNITWEGGPINPGEFQEFEVSVGPLPTGVESILFPTIQTYSSGEEVRWVDESEEGERPAPRLRLVAAEAEAEAGAGASGESASGAVAVSADVASESDVDDAKTVAYIGIALGAIGLVTGVGGIAFGRRRSAS